MGNDRIIITKLATDRSNWVTYRDRMVWAFNSQQWGSHLTESMTPATYTAAGIVNNDMTSISLACGFAHFTVSLRFSLTYVFPSFRCLSPLPCALADLPLRHFTVVPLSLALPLLTLVPRPLRIPLLYNTCIYT